MSIVADTRTYLLTQSGVTDLVSTRIYYMALPQNATLPAVVLEQTTSSKEGRHLSGACDLFATELNVLAYDDDYTGSAALADALDSALDNKTGTWGSSTVVRAFADNPTDTLVGPRDGSEANHYIRLVNLTVWHR